MPRQQRVNLNLDHNHQTPLDMKKALTSCQISRRQFLATCALISPSLTAFRLKLSTDPSLFRTLFNGTSLGGWHTNPKPIGHGTGGRWQVENGELTGEQEPPGSGNGGLLLTDQVFGDFELKLELKPDWGPCSGVFFRCTDEGAGFQMYVDYHDRGNVGHLRGEMPGSFALMPYQIFSRFDNNQQLTGFDTRTDVRAKDWPPDVYEFTCKPEQWLRCWRLGDWNQARIRCEGKYPTVTVWINGTRICRFNGQTCTLPAYDKEHVYKTLGGQGSIGLQVHGGKDWPTGAKCRWRNIEVRDLTETRP